jgi:hypothetical protein
MDGAKVPAHFHITEVGLLTRKFIDCGWTMRETHVVNLQIRIDHDTDHRLSATKLLKIIDLSNKHIDLADHTIEVEYQWATIEKYSLSYSEGSFILNPTYTDCLAKDTCGITPNQEKKKTWLLSWFSKKKNDTPCAWSSCC